MTARLFAAAVSALLLGSGIGMCLAGALEFGGLVFAAGLLLSLHVAANWRQP